MRIGLLRKQQPFAEFVRGKWRVWYIYNNDVTSGTYYELSINGVCDRVTVNDGSIMSIDRVFSPPPSTTEAVETERFKELEQQFDFDMNYSL